MESSDPDSNYRIYTVAHAGRLGFIRQCRSLDMTLDEVRVLLCFTGQPQADCAEVNDLLDEHIGHVVQRIHERGALEVELRALRGRCDARHAAADCGILQGIEDAAGQAGKSAPRRLARGAH